MIPDAFYLIVGTIIQAIAALFSLLNFVFPTAQITNALVTLAGYLNYLGGIIDIPQMMAVLTTFFTFLTVWYVYKLILFIIHATPWVGNPRHPTT